MKDMNIVYNYLDYRQFIKDRLARMRETDPSFSYRTFNEKAGLKSSGHIKLIMDGHRNIGKKIFYNVCKGLGLSERESRFFESLVRFNQASTLEDKERYYQQVLEGYPPRYAKQMEINQYKIFSHWVYVAILELVRVNSFKADPQWISAKIRPDVGIVEIKHALHDLEELGLIASRPDGTYYRTEKMICTPNEVQSVTLAQFHEQMTNLAVEALKRDDVTEKEFSTLTIALSKEKIGVLKNKMQEFKKELHSLLEGHEDEGNLTDVVHVNLQLFKLTRDEEEHKGHDGASGT
jgi:uncharacterized protein (TIGR02147 family)